MNYFVKGIFYDQLIRVEKMLEVLQSPNLDNEINKDFLSKTVDMLLELQTEMKDLINSDDLDIESLAQNNIIKYNTYYERLQTIELFRYLVIVNYGEPEIYFKKKVSRIYDEINCFQKTPIITTISNSESYYWALPSYDIIAVPAGEEKNLLNLPDLFHEMGHLIYNQYENYLKGTIEDDINQYYQSESKRVFYEQRSVSLIEFYREKNAWWISSWVMEFTCDLLATYLVGPAYAWTNLKLTTLSSGKNRIYHDTPSHPSDEARMRGIFYMLRKMGHLEEEKQIQESWEKFLAATNNPIPSNYMSIFPQHVIQQLADFVYDGCKSIGLILYSDQKTKFSSTITRILNSAWEKVFVSPDAYKQWESEIINELRQQT